MKQVREVVKRHEIDKIQQCLDDQIDHGVNQCVVQGDIGSIVNILARASVVGSMMNQGMTLTQAMRELGRRMRAVAYSS